MAVEQKDKLSSLSRVDKSSLLPLAFPPDWAVEWGEDKYGLFAVLEVKEAMQRFRWLVPGTFTMGSPTDELERRQDEIEHSVTLTKGFWLADTACTHAFWTALKYDNPGFHENKLNQPYEYVSWNEVQEFITQLNSTILNLGARLPTEAEWEYACRAGTKTPFSFGATITPEQVNYNGNYPYAGGKKGEYREKTVPVKSLPPNAWGLYEMHGNVWEWCRDCYGVYPDGPVNDPVGPPDGAARVLRGGSWIYGARYARSAYRAGYAPDGRLGGIGFRLALG